MFHLIGALRHILGYGRSHLSNAVEFLHDKRIEKYI
jgi:hypothetical protein